MRRTVAALIALLLPAVAAAQPSPVFNNLQVNGGITGGGVTATGSTTARTLAARAADIVNVKDYGAKGNTTGFTDATISASGTTLTSNSATFTGADVGKSIILQGSGTSTVPQQGTITAFNSAHNVSVSFTAVHATPWNGAWAATVVAGGSGYSNGQTLTAPGGTCVTQPTYTTTVAVGVVTVLTVANAGECSVLPSGTVSLTGGGGTGATATLTGYQVGGLFVYGTDDTTAVTNAVAAGVTAGKCAYFPAGGYWLVSQTTSISLQAGCLVGDREPRGFFPYVTDGSTLLISNTATAAFSAIGSTVVRNMGFYYPLQDGSQASPTVYPALFETALSQLPNNWFDHIHVVNAYRVFHSSGAGTFGRSFITGSLIYGIDKVFYMQNGFADVVEIEGGNYFGPGSAGSRAVGGPAYLGRYTKTSGMFFDADVGAASYPRVDGLIMTGGIVQAYGKGIVIDSGLMDVSNISNVNWDGIGSVLEINGSAQILSSSFSGGEVYSTNIYDTSVNPPVFNLNVSPATHNSELTISGIHFSFALGPIVKDTAGTLNRLTLSGNSALNFGRSTTGGVYYFFQQNGGGAATLTLDSNTISCAGATATASGFLVQQSSGLASVTGNTFNGCATDIVNAGNGGKVVVTGNTATGTVGASINDASTSGALLMASGNFWDKSPTPRNPVLSACGLTPTLSAVSDNFDGQITIGTGGVTSCTVSYTSTLPEAARAVVLTAGSAGAGTLAVTTNSTTQFIFSTSAADISGLTIYYHVVE